MEQLALRIKRMRGTTCPHELLGMSMQTCSWGVRTRGRLSARDVCVLSWFASQAGRKGPAESFAPRPDAPSGHYPGHLDTILPPSETMKNEYTLHVPSYDKYSLGRVVLETPALPLHEVLHEELNAQRVKEGFA